MRKQNFIGAKISCNGKFREEGTEEFKCEPHKEHEGLGRDIWEEDTFEREHVSRLKMFYGILEK